MDPVRSIADAVLYEGYLLWPYRRSALKNQRRWTFGGVFPAGHSRRHPDDRAVMRTECLVEGGPGTTVDVRVRFLHVLARRVARVVGGRLEDVDELVVAGERHLRWEEATEREVVVPELTLGPDQTTAQAGVDVPAGVQAERLREPGGAVAGMLLREWEALEGTVEVAAAPPAEGLWRLSAEIRNETPWELDDRQAALARTFCSCHTVLRVRDGAFVSLTDPPPEHRAAARACHNEGTWPVLAGEPGDRSTLLSSPIILEDHPRIAPESPGDLFDGGEIDQLLTLTLLTLTEEERAEMRDTDPRAREILDRTESLTPDQLLRLHGVMHELREGRR
jgi:hypothetical protein